MINSSLNEIAPHLGQPHPSVNASFQGISTDTRTLLPGNLFIAIQGETYDGQQFLAEAMAKGAAAALVSKRSDLPIPQLVVDDPILVLGFITALWRDQFSIPVIGVTGSNGKTTLKNMIASILKAACDSDPNQILATQGNLNNNIGLPLTLARMNEQQRYAVIEMGMNHFGEIAYLSKLAKPSVAVINNAAAAHLAGLQDVAGVARAKGEIFLGLTKNGIAVLNHDDEYFNYWRGLIGTRKYITFGLDHAADVNAIIGENQQITIKIPHGEISLTLPLLGKHNVMNALAATAVCLALKIDPDAIKFGLEHIQPEHGRMQPYYLENNICVIDDTYNANPFSLQAAINTVSKMAGNKVLILGDMKELGPNEENIHRTAGEKIRAAGINHLLTYGKLSALTSETFGENAQHFTDRDALVTALQALLKNNTIVLIKGSRSMQMEKIVAKIVPIEKLEHAH